MPAPLTDEDRGFIRAILDHPDEDTTWLAYADWLDERDDPRAEFLRLTVRHRRLPPEDTDGPDLAARLSELRATLDPTWMLVFDPAPLAHCRGAARGAWCPLTWVALAPTDVPDIRLCHACKSPVFYCHTVGDARQYTSAGQCVALSTRIPDKDNPFLDREEHAVDLFETDEYPLPPAEVPDDTGETTELPSGDFVRPDPPPAPPPPPPRPWWKFW